MDQSLEQCVGVPSPGRWAEAGILRGQRSPQGLKVVGFLKKFLFFHFLGPHPRHMEVPRLGVQSELQLPAYTPATATGDPSHICDLHHSP